MPSPQATLKSHRIKPKKSLGQNFLCDPSTAATIIKRCHFSPQENIIEIGAGTGALTIPAARRAACVQAIETDGRLIGILKQSLGEEGLGNVIVTHADFMELDPVALFGCTKRPLAVIGNLPYHLSSQILVRLITHRRMIDRAVLMFQRELAERLTAPPGNKNYGRLTVMLRYCAETTSLLRVKRQLFFPSPQIDSEVIQIVFKQPAGSAEFPDELLFCIVKAAFARRRKTIKNNLCGGSLGLSPSQWEEIFRRAGVSPGERAEVLDVGHYVDICRYYREMTES